MGFFTLDLVMYIFAIVLALGSMGGAIPTSIQQVQIMKEMAQLHNLGVGYAHLCQQSDFKCKDVTAGTTMTSGAAPVENGYVPVVQTPPIGKGAVYDVAVAALPSNSASYSVVPYSTVQVDGSLIQNVEVYAVTANGTQAPKVTGPTTPVNGTVYTLEYDPCLMGVIATTATAPISSCP